MFSRIFPKLPGNLARRQMSFISTKLVYEEFGEPADVVKMVEEKLDSPKSHEVTVKILGSPINPADINTIQGISGCLSCYCLLYNKIVYLIL